MKEKIIEIIKTSGIDSTEVKASRIIILFNQHLIDKARESSDINNLLEKTFITL